MSNFNLKIEKKIAILEFDQPDSKVNVLNTQVMQELASIIEELAKKSCSQEVKALLITSKKDNVFIAGADIKEIENITSSQEAKEKAESGKRILNNLAGLNLITVAVIDGACLGGGFELALACKYRVASFNDKVRIGLPEVNLGIIPGFGGTQRLPRLVGLTKALVMILSGQMIPGKVALRYGVVDKLFPQVRLIDDSLDFVNSLLEGKIKINKKKKKFFQKFLEDTHLGRLIVFSQTKEKILKKTKGFYPAPLKAIELIKRTYRGNIRKGFFLESEAFSKLAVTEVSKNLIKVFYLYEEFKKYPWVDSKIKPGPINKCGVLGAGVMGGGIAQLISCRDIPVRLKDINYRALQTAFRTAAGLFAYAQRKRKFKPHQVTYKFGLISPTTTYRGFENSDIVIEAVVEDLGIKQKVFKELSQVVSAKTILASNTSALPITKMAQVTNSADRVVGLHFFNPVHRMPLVEVIKSPETSEQTLAGAIAFARSLGKIVIVVKDVPGFLINRILLSYLNEAGFLVEEGIKIEHIDRIALKFGMPMGPMELIDEVGIDVGHKVAKILEEAYGSRMQVSRLLDKVKEKGLLGKKAKLGFYIHKKKKKIPNPDIYKLIESFPKKSISDDIAFKRMIYVMINEAARCLEERVVDNPQTIDIGMIMGTGFPPHRAGLLRYADTLGIDNIVKELEVLEQKFKTLRFKPCNYLLDMQKRKDKFYH